MKNQDTILDTLRNDELPYWYLYDGSTITARSGETVDMDESLHRLKSALAELPAGTYRLKAANNPKKHNGAAWYDVAIETRKSRYESKSPTMEASNNPYGISDSKYAQIEREIERNLLFKMIVERFTAFEKEWVDYKRMIDKMHEDFYRDEDGNGIADFAENIGHVAKAADSVSAVKKVFTGGGLFD
ncbi:hypothetical protein GCM10028807_50000 [Spirosoma daeguense]